MTPQEIDFLQKLAALTKETGVALTGCGCCGLPYLTAAGDGEGYATVKGSDVEWVSEAELAARRFRDPEEKPEFFKAQQ